MAHNARTVSRDDYCTPDDLYDQIAMVYGFTHDMAASDDNKKTVNYFTEEHDAIHCSWAWLGRLWCNPPFSRKEEYLQKAVEHRDTNDVIVFILPNTARETSFWRKYVWGVADQVITLTPRVNYILDGKVAKGCAFGSCLIIYYPRLPGVEIATTEGIWNWKEERRDVKWAGLI